MYRFKAEGRFQGLGCKGCKDLAFRGEGGCVFLGCGSEGLRFRA